MTLERNKFSDISTINASRRQSINSSKFENKLKWLKPRLLSCILGVILVILGIVVLLPFSDTPAPPAPLKADILKLFLPIMSIVFGAVLTFLGVSLGETSDNRIDEDDNEDDDSIYMNSVEKIVTQRMRTQKDENDDINFSELENDLHLDPGSSRRDSGIVIHVIQPSPPEPSSPAKRTVITQSQDNIMRLSLNHNEINDVLSNIDGDDDQGSGSRPPSRRGSIKSWSRVKI